MTGKVLARLIIAILAGIALGGIVSLAIYPRAAPQPLPALPSPPTITAPRGDPPDHVVSFLEQVWTGSSYAFVGCGFLLQMPDGEIVGVTTAHSLGEGHFAPVAFSVNGSRATVATFAELRAPLGHPRTGADITIDYVLMRPDAPVDPALALPPDPRGGPQPGERVALYSGLGDGQGGQSIFEATVESVDDHGVWIRLDEEIDVRGMSGSPVISLHTGKVVGMTIMMNRVAGAVRLGLNPIGALLDRITSP